MEIYNCDHSHSASTCDVAHVLESVTNYRSRGRYNIPDLEVQIIAPRFDAALSSPFDDMQATWHTVAALVSDEDTLAAAFQVITLFAGALHEYSGYMLAEVNRVVRIVEAIDLLSATLDVSYVFDFEGTSRQDLLGALFQPTITFNAAWVSLADRLSAELADANIFQAQVVEPSQRMLSTFLVGAALSGQITEPADILDAILYVDPAFVGVLTDENMDLLIAAISAYNRFSSFILRRPIVNPQFAAAFSLETDAMLSDWEGGG